MYKLNIEKLEAVLINHFNPAMALTLACMAADSLAETQAWVEIDEQEFSRRCGGYFSEGEHVYYIGSHQFKSKQLYNGGHKFFILMTSRPGVPLKGWFKRFMYRVRRDNLLSQEDGNTLFHAINDMIRADIAKAKDTFTPDPAKQTYIPRAKQYNSTYPQGWQTA